MKEALITNLKRLQPALENFETIKLFEKFL